MSDLLEEAMVTQDDVAKHAGVERSTVSLVINGSPKISDKTKKKVMKAIEELGYYPNSMARALKTARTETVAILINDATSTLYSSVIRTAHQFFMPCNYNIILCHTYNSRNVEINQLNTLIEKRVDGIIVVSNSSYNNNSHFDRVVKKDIPLVLINNYGSDCIEGVQLNKIYIDYKEGMRNAIRALVELGHRSILGIGLSGKGPKIAHVLRGEGYQMAMEEYGFRGRVIDLEEPSYELALRSVETIKEELGNEYTAAVCVNDLVGAAVIDIAKECNLKIGSDFSVIGFDDLEFCQFTSPPLTSVRHPLVEATRIAAEWILKTLNGQSESKPLNVMLPCDIIVRQSIGCVRSREKIK